MTLEMMLEHTLSGQLLEIEGGILSITRKKSGAVGKTLSLMMSIQASSQAGCTKTLETHQLFKFNEIIGKGFDSIPPLDSCKWDTSQLYTKGQMGIISNSLGSLSVEKENKIRSFLAYPSPITQGESFDIGIEYIGFTPSDYFILYIFDIFGQVHLKKVIQLTPHALYPNYSEVKINSSEFFHMSVGVYIMTLLYDGKVQAKTKIGVRPADK
jgi:hypothetical protein